MAALVAMLVFVNVAHAAEGLIISDIHFNPFADQSLANTLALAPVEQWQAILDRGHERISLYGEDTDWKLLQSALSAIRARPKPDFVLAPGDFLAHGFRDKFNAGVVQRDDVAYSLFVAKTMRFLALELEAATGHAPILPALGNNDSDCGDYAVAPNGRFLADTEATVAAMIGKAADNNFAKDWTALGNYSVPLKGLADTSVIALNDNFLSPDYRNSCGGVGGGNPARATLDWLHGALDRAATAHRKVILIYHIPPGVDAFSTAKQSACPISPVSLLAKPYAEELHGLMRRYRGTIVADIAGHLHTDAFRILRDGDAAFGFVMIEPALSPIFAQNPAFRLVSIGADDAITDSTTFYLANLLQAGAGAAPEWREEASFDRAWNASGFDTASLDKLFHDIAASPETRQRWIESYGVQGPAGGAITPQSAATYRCSVGTDQLEDFSRCLCGGAAR